MDPTLVWLLGFIPVWILGVVDYHGSRLLELRRVRWPTTLAVTRVLTETFEAHGPPARMLTDNASIFCSGIFEDFLAQNSVRHSRIRPAHAWTNDRIERLFRTFKETVRHFAWVCLSVRQIDRWCADFRQFYNRDRPHSSYGGLTPGRGRGRDRGARSTTGTRQLLRRTTEVVRVRVTNAVGQS